MKFNKKNKYEGSSTSHKITKQTNHVQHDSQFVFPSIHVFTVFVCCYYRNSDSAL